MLQASKLQGEIWKAALRSQGLVVIWKAKTLPLDQMFDQMHQAQLSLPDLVLMDVGTLDSNPYALCRWCRDHYPEQRLILTNCNQKEISEPERRWALHQGAQELLPGFQLESVLQDAMTAVSRVLEVLNWRTLQPEPLARALTSALNTQVALSSTPLDNGCIPSLTADDPSLETTQAVEPGVELQFVETPPAEVQPVATQPAAEQRFTTYSYRGVTYSMPVSGAGPAAPSAAIPPPETPKKTTEQPAPQPSAPKRVYRGVAY